MQLNNKKLVNRGVLMLMDELHIDQKLAAALLEKHKSVKNVLDSYKSKFL
jgi:N-acetylmuramic acid 6-phosphate etherase